MLSFVAHFKKYVKLDLIVNNEEYDQDMCDAEATITSLDQMLSLF